MKSLKNLKNLKLIRMRETASSRDDPHHSFRLLPLRPTRSKSPPQHPILLPLLLNPRRRFDSLLRLHLPPHLPATHCSYPHLDQHLLQRPNRIPPNLGHLPHPLHLRRVDGDHRRHRFLPRPPISPSERVTPRPQPLP